MLTKTRTAAKNKIRKINKNIVTFLAHSCKASKPLPKNIIPIQHAVIIGGYFTKEGVIFSIEMSESAYIKTQRKWLIEFKIKYQPNIITPIDLFFAIISPT